MCSRGSIFSRTTGKKVKGSFDGAKRLNTCPCGSAQRVAHVWRRRLLLLLPPLLLLLLLLRMARVQLCLQSGMGYAQRV
jgi:hypothetical protein